MLLSSILLAISLVFSQVLPVQATNTLPPGCSVRSNLHGMSNVTEFRDDTKIVHVGGQWVGLRGSGSETTEWYNYENLVWVRCD